MKTAGDILSVLFDEGFAKKAQGYSSLFDSWKDITAKNGIASAAAHSRIKDIDRGILLIEMDHPGWKQILQTKQSKLLNDFRIRFPDMDITGIALILGQPGQSDETQPEMQPEIQNEPQKEIAVVNVAKEPPVISSIEDIKDDELRETLIKLGKTIAEREKLATK
jgi:hypothetical protein